MAEEGSKLTLRRLEAPIHKFTKVALPTDLERLEKHHSNIQKVGATHMCHIRRCDVQSHTHIELAAVSCQFQRCQQWDRLHQEHINASRTVQQLRANIREMEKLCGRVRPEDGPALERLVQPIRDRASVSARDFLLLHSIPTPPPVPLRPAHTSTCPPGRSHDDDDLYHPPPATQTQLRLPEIPADQSAAESWDTLEGSQQEKIDSIEDNVNTAVASVEEGTRSLGKAVGYSLAVLPVAGAVLGGVLAGPLGLLAGFKAAGVAAALGGGALGFAGGNLVQKSRNTRLESRMKQLTAQPDTPSDALATPPSICPITG
ncbi:syntaxin-17 isoform X2 [Osmerus eperlanus]|uniref:syntaxin-17 isoform X2 n=1 Tax=Osmerus eperlanus TaxID=29151 RepID=UPI002E11D6DB